MLPVRSGVRMPILRLNARPNFSKIFRGGNTVPRSVNRMVSQPALSLWEGTHKRWIIPANVRKVGSRDRGTFQHHWEAVGGSGQFRKRRTASDLPDG